MELTDEFRFFGLVIAQGSIDLEGGSRDRPSVFGATSSRNPRQVAQRLTGSAVLQNSQCAVRRAIVSNEALTRIRPLAERGWVDLTAASL